MLHGFHYFPFTFFQLLHHSCLRFFFWTANEKKLIWCWKKFFSQFFLHILVDARRKLFFFLMNIFKSMKKIAKDKLKIEFFMWVNFKDFSDGVVWKLNQPSGPHPSVYPEIFRVENLGRFWIFSWKTPRPNWKKLP